MNPREFWTLLGVGLENLAYSAVLSSREAGRLASQGWWWRLKAGLARSYALDPAFKVCKREGPASGLPESDVTFGETPLLTAYEFFREVGLGAGDTVVDLGCGRGGLVLLAALGFGARGIGFEVLPTFVRRAQRLARELGVPGRAEFRQEDFRRVKLPMAELYLLSATCLDAVSWDEVKRLMAEAPAGALAMSISAPLPRLSWEPIWERKLAYSWGPATTYLQRRTGAISSRAASRPKRARKKPRPPRLRSDRARPPGAR